MSSLLQFAGQTSHKGVLLEFVLMAPGQRWPDSPNLGIPQEVVPCHHCKKYHERIYRAWRKPRGMYGPWVVFQYNGTEHVPDLSIPISVFKLPKDAKPVTDEENSILWHRS